MKTLFDRYMTQQASPSEELELMWLLACVVPDEEREQLVGEWFDRVPAGYSLSREEVDAMCRRIVQHGHRARSWRKVAAVAAGIA
ncbi:MAG: hypothetical protein LBF09_04510, partial [Odoribacteraceae bacterium]|nr:hypothetical protein [Odoribacteraceae bacterium]